MKVSNIKAFYVEHRYNDAPQKSFRSLIQAVQYAVTQADEDLLIHIGWYNLVYYKNGDTVEELYRRCKKIIADIK